MTEAQARAYLDRTNWYEMVERVYGEKMPEEVRKKREEAYMVLKKGEEN